MDKLTEFENLRLRLREEHKMLNKSNVNIGDFTYGVPTVFSWDESTTLTIGKFCSIASNVSILLGGGAQNGLDFNVSF